MKLTWQGHACYTLESADGTVVFDPYEPGYVPGLTLPELSADVVLCSHYHRDHGCAEAVKQLKRRTNFIINDLPCYHDDQQGALRGENRIHMVDAEGKRIVHMGDLGHMLSDSQIEALGEVDVLIIPVGGFYTIDAATAFELAGKIGAKITIPMHYRGEGFGYDVISTVDEYAKLSGNAEYMDSSELSLDGVLGHGRTVVLKCPVAEAKE